MQRLMNGGRVEIRTLIGFTPTAFKAVAITVRRLFRNLVAEEGLEPSVVSGLNGLRLPISPLGWILIGSSGYDPEAH